MLLLKETALKPSTKNIKKMFIVALKMLLEERKIIQQLDSAHTKNSWIFDISLLYDLLSFRKAICFKLQSNVLCRENQNIFKFYF